MGENMRPQELPSGKDVGLFHLTALQLVDARGNPKNGSPSSGHS
jgi:hypothetical protein